MGQGQTSSHGFGQCSGDRCRAGCHEQGAHRKLLQRGGHNAQANSAAYWATVNVIQVHTLASYECSNLLCVFIYAKCQARGLLSVSDECQHQSLVCGVQFSVHMCMYM